MGDMESFDVVAGRLTKVSDRDQIYCSRPSAEQQNRRFRPGIGLSAAQLARADNALNNHSLNCETA